MSNFDNCMCPELDVLASLAIVSDFYEGPTCRPTIVDDSNSNRVPQLKAKGLGHPILRNDSVSSCAFVPNDITLGGSGNSSFILLTGPNMGGKSTLLRQVCLSVILAQVHVKFWGFIHMYPVHCTYEIPLIGRSRCPS